MFLCLSVFALASQAVAQDEIIVESQWLGSESFETKRDADAIIDVIGPDTLTLQASSEVANALAFLPGVALDTEGGEQRFVQLRGIRPALNAVTVDGLLVGAAENLGGGRQVPLDVYSTKFARSIVVSKTQLPDMEGQGIGGTINIVSLSPLTGSSGFSGITDLRIGVGENEVTPALEGTGLLNWVGMNNRLGVQLSLTGSRLDQEIPGVVQGRWREWDNAPWLPNRTRSEREEAESERIQGAFAIGFKPIEGHQVDFRISNSNLTESDDLYRYEDQINDIVSYSENDGIARITSNGRVQRTNEDRQNSLAHLKGRHRFEDVTLGWYAAWNETEFDREFVRWEVAGRDADVDLPFQKDDEGFLRIDRSNSISLEDLNLRNDERLHTELDVREESWIGGLDLSWKLNAALDFKTGVRVRETERSTDKETDRSTFVSDPDFVGEVINNDTVIGNAPLVYVPFETLENSDAASPENLQTNVTASFIESNSDDYELTETVSAAYLMARWTFSDLVMVTGVRHEKTSLDAEGQFLVLPPEPLSTERDESVWLPMALATYRPTENWVFRAGIGKRIGRPDYDLIAPRAGVLFDEGRSLIAVQVSNPDLEARTSLNYDLSAEFYVDDQRYVGVSLFRKEIENDIVVIERVFNGAEVRSRIEETTIPYEDFYDNFDNLFLTTARNISDYTVDGLELFGGYSFFTLAEPWNNFYVSGALTFTNEDGEVERTQGVIENVSLPEQTDFNASLSVVYEDEKFTGWLGYRYGNGAISGLRDERELDVYQSPQEQLDFHAEYQASQSIEVYLDALNLTDESAFEHQGFDENQKLVGIKYGRTVYAGVRYNW